MHRAMRKPDLGLQKQRPLVAALTGATGFLGRYVVASLKADGWRVRTLVRSMPLHEQLAAHQIEVVPGDLGDELALQRLTRGADVIIHLAGAIKGDDEALMRINGAGTARLVDAWQRHAPQARFIGVSSLTAREPQLSGYGASKQAAEQAVIAAKGNWLVVRPPAVYGPHDTETLSIFKAAQLPLHPMLNGPQARLSLIHVRDAAQALCALAKVGPKNQIIELSDPASDGYSWPQVVRAACAASSRKARPFLIPPLLVRAVASLNGSLARMRGKISIFDSGKAREILHPNWAAQPHLRVPKEVWTPKVSIGEGFLETAQWYRKAGWL